MAKPTNKYKAREKSQARDSADAVSASAATVSVVIPADPTAAAFPSSYQQFNYLWQCHYQCFKQCP